MSADLPDPNAAESCAPASPVVLALADAKRIVRLIDAYAYVASKASKWGYGVDCPSTCFAAEHRLRSAIAASSAEAQR